jgi:hypothetical protein
MADTINSEVGFAKGFSKSSLLSIPKRKVKTGVSAYGQSGVIHWLDANRFDTLTLNAGRVSSWRDWVGGVDFIQNTAGSQPLYVASHANFNNKPSVFSDTVPKALATVVTQKQIFLRDNWFLACILQPSAYNTSSAGTGVFGTSLNANIAVDTQPGLMWFGSTNNSIQWGASGVVSTPSNLNPYIVVITNNGKISLNGVISTFANFNNKTTALNRLFRYLGTVLASSNALNYLGHFSELIIGSGEMSDADILRWSDNINANYLIY